MKKLGQERRKVLFLVTLLACSHFLVNCNRRTHEGLAHKASTETSSPTGLEKRGEESLDDESLLFIEFSTTGGPMLGPQAQERQSHLVINGKLGQVTLHMLRSGGNDPGQAIGLFSMPLQERTRKSLSAAIDAVNWKAPLGPKRGGPGRSLLSFEVQKKNLDKKIHFSSMDVETKQNLNPLLQELQLLVAQLYRQPQRALRLDLERGSDDSSFFELVFRNVGVEDFCVLDPRRLGTASGKASAGLRVAVAQPTVPGVTAPPLDWKNVGLLPISPNQVKNSAPVTLKVGEELRFSVQDWQPSAGQRYIAQAIVSDYEAPVRVGGTHCVRGALYSKPLFIEP